MAWKELFLFILVKLLLFRFRFHRLADGERDSKYANIVFSVVKKAYWSHSHSCRLIFVRAF